MISLRRDLNRITNVADIKQEVLNAVNLNKELFEQCVKAQYKT